MLGEWDDYGLAGDGVVYILPDSNGSSYIVSTSYSLYDRTEAPSSLRTKQNS